MLLSGALCGLVGLLLVGGINHTVTTTIAGGQGFTAVPVSYTHLDVYKRQRQYELEPWKSRGLRVAPVDNYLVLYIPDDDTQVVTIIRVMYGGRDVNTQLNRFTKTK